MHHEVILEEFSIVSDLNNLVLLNVFDDNMEWVRWLCRGWILEEFKLEADLFANRHLCDPLFKIECHFDTIYTDENAMQLLSEVTLSITALACLESGGEG